MDRIFRKLDGEHSRNISNLYILHGENADRYLTDDKSDRVQNSSGSGCKTLHTEPGNYEPSILESNSYEGAPAGTTEGAVVTTTEDLPERPNCEMPTTGNTQQGPTQSVRTENPQPLVKAKPTAQTQGETPRTAVSSRDNTQNPKTQGKTPPKAVSPTSTQGKTPRSEDAVDTSDLVSDGQVSIIADNRVVISEGIPEIMRPTAELFLHTFGRKRLTPHEVKRLRELARIHTPTRINKAILEAAECISKKDTPMKYTSFGYIYEKLKNQNSLEATRRGNAKGSKGAPKGKPVELSVLKDKEAPMAVSEAERVITEYVPSANPVEQFPVALEELHGRILEKGQEVWEEYAASLPKDEDGLEIFPEYENDDDVFAAGSMTADDYLRAKFPDASEAELSTETLSPCEQEDIKTAFEIDYACAKCTSCKSCGLPSQWCANKKRSRPVVMLRNGQLSVGYSPKGVLCKHECGQSRPDPDFERRVKKSGLSEQQAGMTIASYSHEKVTPEVVIAKARAILASKNKTNLILAGKPGTGKTHLAIGIAQEAMKAGRGAIVKTLPEMLDEICDAYRANVDPLRVMMKYKTIPCLVIDDWGKEKTSEARQDYLYQIIDGRYQRGLQTIVTTNALCPEELAKPWDKYDVEALISRILENGEWVSITEAPNWRLKREEPPAADDCLAEISAEEEEAWKVMRETIDDAAGTVLTPEEPKRSYAEYLPGMTIIHVPHYDDGLDDETDI